MNVSSGFKALRDMESSIPLEICLWLPRESS